MPNKCTLCPGGMFSGSTAGCRAFATMFFSADMRCRLRAIVGGWQPLFGVAIDEVLTPAMSTIFDRFCEHKESQFLLPKFSSYHLHTSKKFNRYVVSLRMQFIFALSVCLWYVTNSQHSAFAALNGCSNMSQDQEHALFFRKEWTLGPFTAGTGSAHAFRQRT